MSALLVLAAAGIAACTGSGRSGAPTDAEIGALLQRHGAALVAHDEQRFLADIDTAKPAADFRARQRAVVEAVHDLPLASWTYRVSAPVTEPDALDAATKRYGGQVRIVDISFGYALSGIDAAPTTHDLWWTFVRRRGHVVAAGDDDMADLGGPSWRGPWDFGSLVAVQGKASLVIGHPAQQSRIASLAQLADAAVPAVSAVWGNDWRRRVAVLVPSSSAELAAESGGGQGLSLTDLEAVTVSDPVDPATGQVTGQRVIMNPATLGALTPIGAQIVVRHEVTHVASAAATTDETPRWLVEGLAEYVANLGTGQAVTTAAAELSADVRAGHVPTALPGEQAFTATGAALARTYEQSWLACRLVAQRVGAGGLVHLYRLAGAPSSTGAVSIVAALQSVLHETLPQFTAQWRAYMQAELT